METSSPEETLKQVELLLNRNRTRDARSLLKTALLNHPEDVGLLLQTAWVDYLEDDEDSALSTIRTVLAAAPEHPSARLLYFELLVGKKQHADAERVILELLRDYPENEHYYGRYAHLMLNTLNVSKARHLAEEGLRYDSESDECLVVKTICDLIEQRAGATSLSLQQLLVRHPQSMRTLLYLVIALEERGDLKGAERVARELVLADPSNEHLVELAHALRIKAHWSMLPMWPMMKFGWGGSIGIWLISIFTLRVVAQRYPELSAPLTVIFIIYVVYSWTWPSILRRLIRA